MWIHLLTLELIDGAGGGVSPAVETFSGGYEYALRGPKRRDPEDIRQDRVRFGIIPARIIEDVALRQAEDLRLDEQQRMEELRGELRLQGLEMQSRHLEALNARREQLIREEISLRIRAKMEEEEIIVLLLLASSV